MDGLVGATATQLARAVREGRVSPVEVIEAHLAHAERVDAEVGAFRSIRRERSLAEARELAGREDLTDLPLAGVPVAVKDNVAVAGERLTAGCETVRAAVQAEDHEVIRRLRAAGAIVLGVTRMPELGVWGTTEGSHNPWRLDRTPGGSSGGSAAAVASGSVPLAQGNDGLGSIRIPAACCGLLGIKPGPGVVPSDIGASDWFGMSQNGPLATTVDDLAIGLAVMADRPDLADSPPRPAPLRVAVSYDSPLPGSSVDREWKEATARTARLLRSAGHEIAGARLGLLLRGAVPIFARWCAGAAQDVAHVGAERLQSRNRAHAALGRAALRWNLIRPVQSERLRGGVVAFFDRVDLLVTPTLATPPVEADGWERRSWPSNVMANARYAPMCAPWNYLGYPAAALPVGVHSDGTPLSVQLVARPGQEALLLAVARQLETAAPWPRHAPGRVAPRGG